MIPIQKVINTIVNLFWKQKFIKIKLGNKFSNYVINSMFGDSDIFIAIYGNLHTTPAESILYSPLIVLPVSTGSLITTPFQEY